MIYYKNLVANIDLFFLNFDIQKNIQIKYFQNSNLIA